MKSNRKLSLLLPALACLAAVAGCRQDMHNQPKYKALRPSAFFADGSSARPLVEGTVARGTLQQDEAFFTGKAGTALVREMPFPVDDAVVARGQERYNIFCTPCHDSTGNGNGMVVQRGYRKPPSFNEQRLRDAAAGHFVDVMTNGFGAMPDYRAQISARDRWAIVAYIRALQLQQPVATPSAPATPGAAPASQTQPSAGAPAARGGQGQ